MKRAKTVEEFIEIHPKHSKELSQMREIMLKAGMEETVKWGAPVYTAHGENVVGLGSFKSYVGLWFYQGVFLKDSLKVLINAQEGTTKALRQWRFEDGASIPEKDLANYVKEAIENAKQGKKLKPQKKVIAIPEELDNAMKADPELKEKFEALTQGKRNDYAEHIGSAKQAKTRQSRLEKDIPLIMAGVGLHDKYKNC